MSRPEPDTTQQSLARRLGLFDATMIVMGGIIGSGIFMNPHVVATKVHSPLLILGAWGFGGAIALAGAFIYAELAAQRPHAGGQYAYMREAFHPSVAFVYGWALLLVTQTGGMAAVAVTFGKYFLEIVNLPKTDLSAAFVAAAALALLTIINCLGVRAGSTTQNTLMVFKIAAIAALVIAGFAFGGRAPAAAPTAQEAAAGTLQSLSMFGAAMVPVLFAYGGWQTSCFVAAEVREPERNLPRGLLLGVAGVIVVYLAVNFVCVKVLGADGLAATDTPASAVMTLAMGNAGGRLIAVGIAVSTLGFLSQGMLTAPRVYFGMAADGLFFRKVAELNRARVPAMAIAIQGVCAIAISFTGKYEQILNFMLPVDFMFLGLTACTVFVFHRRIAAASSFRIPGHPFTTLFFIAACWAIVLNAIYRYPGNTAIGVLIMLAGVPAYIFWSRRAKRTKR